MDNIKEHIDQINKMKGELSKLNNIYNRAFSKLSKEEQKQITTHSDIVKSMNMMKNGNFDENFLTQIQNKYGG